MRFISGVSIGIISAILYKYSNFEDWKFWLSVIGLGTSFSICRWSGTKLSLKDYWKKE